MPDYRTPGVYIEELVATGPITGVGTSTAAFLGVAGRGAVAIPERVTNLTRFTERYVPAGPLAGPYANLVRGVRGFFENGGTVAYVVRVEAAGKHATITLDGGSPAKPVLKISARDTGKAGEAITVKVTEPADGKFGLEIAGPEVDKDGKQKMRTLTGLSMDPKDPKFVGAAGGDLPVDITVLGSDAPAKVDPPRQLADGADDAPGNIGTPRNWEAALTALGRVDDVSLVCAPGVTEADRQQKLLAHCEQTQDRFAILDSVPPDASGVSKVADQRARVGSARGFAALYHPWLLVADPDSSTGATMTVPPSGHVAGVFARVDAERGVHKAPANELITGALGLETVLDDTEHGLLNEAGINVLRVFPGRSRPVIWGARTTSDDSAWRYVNVRRLMLFVEESVQEGIRFAVFEPNDESLWKRLDRTITEFLTRVWSSGALFGSTPSEAFYVKIDRENNPNPENGQVFIEVGLAPVRPAEFVIVRIGMWAGGGQVQEG